jgi:putative intracellular protease/amidase/DNA-directed RNA polymerase subunit RPC12/RpoP
MFVRIMRTTVLFSCSDSDSFVPLFIQKIFTMKLLLFTVVLLLCVAAVRGQVPPSLSVLAITSPDSLGYFCEPCGNDCDTVAYTHEGVCPHCGMKLVRQTYRARKELLGNAQQKLSICFYLQDGVEVLDFAGPMEVFSYGGFRVFTVSKKKEPLLAQGILKIMPDYSLADAPPADILAFFGGNAGPSAADTALISWIRSRKDATRYYFSVCTGAFILGKAGILDGLTATTFHSSIESLRKELPGTKVLADVRFVDNGRVITTAGISAGIDGALHLVAKLKGEEMAREVASYMEYDKWLPGQGLVLNEGGH